LRLFLRWGRIDEAEQESKTNEESEFGWLVLWRRWAPPHNPPKVNSIEPPLVWFMVAPLHTLCLFFLLLGPHYASAPNAGREAKLRKDFNRIIHKYLLLFQYFLSSLPFISKEMKRERVRLVAFFLFSQRLVFSFL